MSEQTFIVLGTILSFFCYVLVITASLYHCPFFVVVFKYIILYEHGLDTQFGGNGKDMCASFLVLGIFWSQTNHVSKSKSPMGLAVYFA